MDTVERIKRCLQQWQTEPATACHPSILYEKLVAEEVLGSHGIYYLWQREARRLGVEAEWRVIFERAPGVLVFEGKSFTMEHIERILALGLKEERASYVETGVNMCLQWHGVLQRETTSMICVQHWKLGSPDCPTWTTKKQTFRCKKLTFSSPLNDCTPEMVVSAIRAVCPSPRSPYGFVMASCTAVTFDKECNCIRICVQGLPEFELLNAHDFMLYIDPDSDEWILSD